MRKAQVRLLFRVKHTNSKYCRFCIRHEIPKLIKDNYLPDKVFEKINSDSFQAVCIMHQVIQLENESQ